MSGWMTTERLYGWQLALEVKLRRVSGVAFQDFFADVMTRAHGDDYVPTRPWGTTGDKGCDGYLASTGEVFACYGKVDDAAPTLSDVKTKMDADYKKACDHLSVAMKGWRFVHNMLDGTPTDVTVVKMAEMKAAHPHHTFGVMGRAGFEERILKMAEGDIIALIGPAASAEDTRNMRLELVAELIDATMAAVDKAPTFGGPDPSPVPAEKLDYNKLPNHWRHTIESQMANAKVVGEYLRLHPDPLRGPKAGELFRTRYASLRAQALPPGSIMGKLHQAVIGVGAYDNERVVAANALLTYLFDSCDIFEDKPVEPVPQPVGDAA